MASARPPLPAAIALLFLLCWMRPGFVAAQNPQPPEPAPDQTAETAEADDDDGENRGRRGPRNRNGIKPYDEVITGEAQSDDGVFTVHQLDDKVFYEIPGRPSSAGSSSGSVGSPAPPKGSATAGRRWGTGW